MDPPYVKPSVIDDEVENLIKLFVQMGSVITHHGNPHQGQLLAVLGVDLGGGDIEPIPQPLDGAFDDSPFSLE